LELLVLATVLLAMGATFARILWRRNTDSLQAYGASIILLVASAVGLTLATSLAAVTRVTWLPRHSYYLWIPIVLLIPLLRGTRLRGYGSLGVALIVLFTGLNLYSLYKYFFRYEYSKDDYRSVANYIMASDDQQTPSVLFYGQIRLLRYYGDTRSLDGTMLPLAQRAQEICELAKRTRNIRVIVSHEPFIRLLCGADLPALVSPTLTSESVAKFQNFKVYRFSRRGNE
jgi:hypothetical protein